MSLLTGRIVCITGSSRGIGRGCAVECAKHGAAGLALHYLGDPVTEQEAHSLKQEIENTYPKTRVIVVSGDIAESSTSTKVGVHLKLVRINLTRVEHLKIVEASVKTFGRIGKCLSD